MGENLFLGAVNASGLKSPHHSSDHVNATEKQPAYCINIIIIIII